MIVEIFSRVFCMSEFKSDRALQNPYTVRVKNQAGFVFPVRGVAGVGIKTCELRISMKTDNDVFRLFFKVKEHCNYRLSSVLLVHF